MGKLGAARCTLSERCKAPVYVRIRVPELNVDDMCCRRHVHMLIGTLIGGTRIIEIEGV